MAVIDDYRGLSERIDRAIRSQAQRRGTDVVEAIGVHRRFVEEVYLIQAGKTVMKGDAARAFAVPELDGAITTATLACLDVLEEIPKDSPEYQWLNRHCQVLTSIRLLLRQDQMATADTPPAGSPAQPPRSSDAVRIIKIDDDLLRSGSVDRVVSWIRGVESQGKPVCRSLRSKVCVEFSSVGSDPRPDWAIPEVRTFISRLHREIPHFFYYLASIPQVGLLRLHLWALTPGDTLEERPDGFAIGLDPSGWIVLLARQLLPSISFCRFVNDDVEDLLATFRKEFPPEWVAVALKAIAAAAEERG